MEVIRLEKVNKSYGKVRALSDLDLSVNEGEIYGFIGPNGAGKSTTIRLLLNFLRADSGSLSVLGFNPAKQDVEIKKQTGYVSAESFMYSDMRVHELFRFTEHYHGIRDGAKLKKLVDMLDIDTSKKFEQLSFGNRKKIAVACALLHSPKLIILDEPSNGLDPVIRNNLYELLQEEQKNGATIFFSSHVLSEVQKVCTRIGLLKDGRLIRENKAEEFTNIGFRQVELYSDDTLNIGSLSGVQNFEQKGNHYHFLFSGNANELIRLLSGINVTSVQIEEPELETVFMHFFKQ
ncbi:Vitamin B12 import ATP-binding protein BtuD [bioreactor metagenome]|uniref:Vitamin B12 import ATP-binding protein BtuD n=1 Tax=bioreactor metagenome TaxID=1076179 RepID=A0A644WTA6_9ZZZZ